MQRDSSYLKGLGKTMNLVTFAFFDIERDDSAFYVHDRTIIIMIIIDLVLN